MNIEAVPQAVQAFFSEHNRVALAFSGGCDSAYLLFAAKACGAQVRAYYVRSCFQPAFELEDARRLANDLDCEMRVLDLDVLDDENVRSNPANRCYHCKRRIFGAILKAARADGFACVMDGTNASDDASDRPGMRALREMQVLSPLRLCGVTKAQVRRYSKEAGLFTWNKPAYACLATRIPAGREISWGDLERIEKGEAALSRLGFSDFRLRLTDRGVRLELTEADMRRLMDVRAQLVAVLEGGFEEITLDLHPRKGMEI